MNGMLAVSPLPVTIWRNVFPLPRDRKLSSEPRSPLVVTSGTGSSRSNCEKSISVIDEISASMYSMYCGSLNQRSRLAIASSWVSATIGDTR